MLTVGAGHFLHELFYCFSLLDWLPFVHTDNVSGIELAGIAGMVLQSL